MDYETLRMISAGVNTAATFLVIPPLIRRGRKYWSAVTTVIFAVGYLNFTTYAAAPSPENAWWVAAVLTALVLIGGIAMGIAQRKYFEREKKLPDTPASE